MDTENITQDKVLVALSGGVDSSVCVRILQQQGFAVQGVVISFSPAHGKAVQAATVAAKELGIPLRVAHCEEAFETEVVHPFCSAYIQGQTPNPCILCNPGVKFKVLAACADEMGIYYIASGHYARIEEENGVYHVARAASHKRDQSYMLYRLPQEILSRLCLPIGEFEKPTIRRMAQEYGLSSAQNPDSQEICFIPDGDYAAYIQGRGYTAKQGRFIGPGGEDLGPHKGVLHYTVGQRRGIGLSMGKPIFVKRIQQNGDILLGWAGQEFSSAVVLRDVVSASGKPFENGLHCAVKIRSMAQPVGCTVQYSGAVQLVFDEAQRAPAPGQSAVLYSGELVLGGGFIEEIIE